MTDFAIRARSVVALLGLSVLAVPAGGHAQEDPNRRIAIDHYDVRIDVERSGLTHVTETLRVRFDGKWNGIEREILLQHRTGRGRRTQLDLEVTAVTDENGQPLRVERPFNIGMKKLRIYVPDAEDATRTVVIRYDVANAIRFFPENAKSGYHDELYWNVTGNSWRLPIRSVHALVSLPDAVEDVQAWVYTGPAGAQGTDARNEVRGNLVEAASTREFMEGEGLTVSVTWKPGLIPRPAQAELLKEDVFYWWPTAAPVFALLLMFGQWRKSGRDPDGRAISVQYEPPEKLTPAEVGTLVDHNAEINDINSTLIDLAVRGYIRIEEREESRFLGLGSKTEYWFHQRRPTTDWTSLLAHERAFLQGLFEKPDKESADPDLPSVKLSSLKNQFYKNIKRISEAIYDHLVMRGFYTKRPDKVRDLWTIIAIALGLAGVAGAAWVDDNLPLAGPVPLAIGLVGSALIIFVSGRLMPARTVKGARARENALGFKEFLGRVDADRMNRMITTPDLFERYLPYAMAFRVEAKWAKKFEDLVREPPDWYVGSGHSSFSSTSFTRNLSSMSATASSTMSSSPSGSGGGGSSGGGSGGGGGGGF
jgi:hypothetical protein